MVDQPETTSQSAQPANPFAVAATLPQNVTEPNEEVKSAPVWLGDLIRDGFYDKVVLIGFPYDEGARKAGNRKGADFAPGKSMNITKDLKSHLDSFPYRLIQKIRERCWQRQEPGIRCRYRSWYPQHS